MADGLEQKGTIHNNQASTVELEQKGTIHNRFGTHNAFT